MNQTKSKMIALAASDAYPLLLLDGRVSYRTAWAMRNAAMAKPFRQKDLNWMLEYDDENNFAHMGERYAGDNWGKLHSAKMRSDKRKIEMRNLFERIKAAAG